MTYYTQNSTNGPSLRPSTLSTATKILPKCQNTPPQSGQCTNLCLLVPKWRTSSLAKKGYPLLSCFAFFVDYVIDLRYLFCCKLKSCLSISSIVLGRHMIKTSARNDHTNYSKIQRQTIVFSYC